MHGNERICNQVELEDNIVSSSDYCDLFKFLSSPARNCMELGLLLANCIPNLPLNDLFPKEDDSNNERKCDHEK